jgi:hypothetical protein
MEPQRICLVVSVSLRQEMDTSLSLIGKRKARSEGRKAAVMEICIDKRVTLHGLKMG